MAGPPRGLQRLLVLWGLVAAPEARALADVTSGPVRLIGTLVCPSPITSPLDGRPCVVYRYRASAVRSGRASSGARRQRLRQATVYADGARLQLDDGTVELIMPESDDFSRETHEALAAKDWPGFRAIENTLRPGHRVLVQGRLIAASDAGIARVRVSALTLAEPTDAETTIGAGAVGNVEEDSTV